ncbi:MAG TPA: hypothetical protein PLA88_07020 [Bacteroidales bacterium]|nr:hypothetical protein [Bacteroidales bacterium]
MRNLFFLLICLALMSNAQGPIKKNITFSANFFRVASLPAQSLNMKLEFEADEHWTVRYEFGYGWQNNGLPYYHLPATISAGVKEIQKCISGDSKLGFLSGFIMILLPEGISYNIRMKDKIEMTPFIDINSREYFAMNQTDTLRNRLSGDLGILCRYSLNPHLYVSAYGSMTFLESEGLGASGGIGIGWKLFRTYPDHPGISPTPGF